MILTIINILYFHWVGDFVFQTNWMALNKSKDNLALLVHVAIYTFFITIPMLVINPAWIPILGYWEYDPSFHYGLDNK